MLSYAVILHSLTTTRTKQTKKPEVGQFAHERGRLPSCTGLSLCGAVTRLEYARERLVMQAEPCRA